MIKKILVGICLFCGLAQTVSAQSSMTDEQVMQYVLKESQKGTSQSEIVANLMKQGVSIDQIQRLKNKYSKQNDGSVMGAQDLVGASRLRQNKADSKTQLKGNNMRKGTQDKVDLSTMSEYQRKQYMESQQSQYLDGLGFVLPDSAAMFDEFMNPKEDKNKKKIFGHDIFNKKELSFETDMNIPAPDDYQLGAGDLVFIDVSGASQMSFNGEVSPEGVLFVEGYGPITVGGLTLAQANVQAKKVLGRYFAGSKISLTVGQTKNITVNVMGEVNMPGTYTLSAFASVFHALYMAGGANEIGTLRNIKVYRNNRLVSTVDIYDYIFNGKLSGNIRLASNDVIVVGPYESLVQIAGKVKRPMYYEMRPTESVSTLLKYSGGFTGDAYQDQVRLIRTNSGRKEVFSIDEFQMGTFKLADGDSLFVDSVLDRYANMVEVKGAVFRPGMYQVGGNVSTVRQLVEQAGGLSEDAFLARAVMHRRKADRTLEVIQVPIKEIMNHEAPDITLKNEDVLFIPSLQDSQDERTLSIFGEVYYPGVYSFAENTTIEDLVLQAGGLKDAASIVKVDVSRRIRDAKAQEASTVVAETFTLELKDGFVIDGQAGFKLQPFDEVFVRKSPGYVEQKHITIEGEVAFAGTYTLTNKGERLSDLVKMAGGLTPGAYPKGARLIRTLSEAERMKQQSLKKFIVSKDSAEIKKFDLNTIRYVGINLDKAIENEGSEEWDLVLQDGDRLIIPQYSNTVTINGEVMYPNSVSYMPGKGLDYYINQAGGFSAKARKRKVFAVNMNGTVTRVRKAKDIQPGCEIVVPTKEDKKRAVSLGEILSIGTTAAALGTMISTLVK